MGNVTKHVPRVLSQLYWRLVVLRKNQALHISTPNPNIVKDAVLNKNVFFWEGGGFPLMKWECLSTQLGFDFRGSSFYFPFFLTCWNARNPGPVSHGIVPHSWYVLQPLSAASFQISLPLAPSCCLSAPFVSAQFCQLGLFGALWSQFAQKS